MLVGTLKASKENGAVKAGIGSIAVKVHTKTHTFINKQTN